MSKQIYVDAADNASDLALNYVLQGNATANAAAIRQVAAATPKGSYKDVGIYLERQYETQKSKGDIAGAETTVNTMAYFSMREKFERAQQAHDSTLDDSGIASVKAVALAGNRWNRINDDQHKATVAAEQRAAQERQHRADLEHQEAARVAALSPRDKALEDVLGKDNKQDIAQVRGTLDRFKGKNRSIEEVRVNIQNDLTDKPLHFWEYDSRTQALKVLNRQEAIVASNGHQGNGLNIVTPAAAATVPAPKAAPAPAHPAAPAPAAGAQPAAAGAHPAAPAAPAHAAAHSNWTPIEKQVQFDLETLNKSTGQHKGWKITDGVDSLDGKNGKHTGESIAAFLKENNLTAFDDAAKAKLHELAENTRKAQAAAKAAAGPAVAAGTGAGQTAGTPSAPAASPAAPAAAASR